MIFTCLIIRQVLFYLSQYFLTLVLRFVIMFVGVINLRNITINLSKKMKILIATLVSFVIVVAVIATVYSLNSVAINNRILYMFMPKTITAEEMETNYDLHVRMNDDYDSKRQASQPLEAYEYYYTDPETNETVVIKGTENAVINDDEIPVYLGFLLRAKMNMNTFGDIVQKVFIVLAVLVVFGLIVLWFKSWSRREDEAKAQIYGKKNQSKGKKSKK